MKIKSFLVALLLVLALVVSAAAQARTNENGTQAQTYGSEGREVAAPPWSAACMTDQGPSQCDEPMWIYGGAALRLAKCPRSRKSTIIPTVGNRMWAAGNHTCDTEEVCCFAAGCGT